MHRILFCGILFKVGESAIEPWQEIAGYCRLLLTALYPRINDRHVASMVLSRMLHEKKDRGGNNPLCS
jgi:hypothetical protein